MPTKLIALPCSASELEAALHKVCDHGGHWANRIHVCLNKQENRYALELHDEAFDGQSSTQDGAALSCGDAAAMREALELVNKIYDLLSKPCIVIEEVRQACQKARAVLIATPLRNCDVGTAEERMYRYNRLRDEINERYERLGEIPPSFAFPTAFEWEDSPYDAEEGGDNESK